jgi:hypothetical protein
VKILAPHRYSNSDPFVVEPVTSRYTDSIPLCSYRVYLTLAILFFFFKTTFRMILSPSSRKNLLSWAQAVEPVLISGERLKSPKRYVLNKKRTMDDVQKHNNCSNLPSSQTFRLTPLPVSGTASRLISYFSTILIESKYHINGVRTRISAWLLS